MSNGIIRLISAIPLLLTAGTALAAQPVDNAAMTITGDRFAPQVSALEARVSSAPNDETAWLNLGILYSHQGRASDATAALQHVLALDNAVVQNQFGDDVWTHGWAKSVYPRTTALTLR